MAELSEYLGVFTESGTCLIETDKGFKMVYNCCGEFMEALKEDLNLFEKEGGEFSLESVAHHESTDEQSCFYILAKRSRKDVEITVKTKPFSEYQQDVFKKEIKKIFENDYKYAFLK